MPWPTTSRQSRGYGKEHDRIRKQLQHEVILCEECKRQGRVTVGRIADHIIPLAKGGSGERSNYQWLCQPCADAKDAADRGVKQRVAIGPDGWPL